MVTIPDLPELLAADVSDSDILVMRDTSAATSPDRRVTRGNFLKDAARTDANATFLAVSASSLAAPTGAIDTMTVATALVMGDKLQKIFVGSGTFGATLAANTGATQTVTVTGAVVGDFVLVQTGNTSTALIVRGYVSGVNTVTIVTHNPTAGVLTLGSAFSVAVLRMVV